MASDKPERTPLEELELVASTIPSRQNRRRFLKAHRRTKKTEWQYPDFMRGLNNRGRMALKKFARGGAETRSRNRRSKGK